MWQQVRWVEPCTMAVLQAYKADLLKDLNNFIEETWALEWDIPLCDLKDPSTVLALDGSVLAKIHQATVPVSLSFLGNHQETSYFFFNFSFSCYSSSFWPYDAALTFFLAPHHLTGDCTLCLHLSAKHSRSILLSHWYHCPVLLASWGGVQSEKAGWFLASLSRLSWAERHHC